MTDTEAIVAVARAEADQLLAAARTEADDLLGRARRQSADADSAARKAQNEADSILALATQQAARMRTLTEEQIAAAEDTVQHARSIAYGDLTAAEHTLARRRQAATAKAICRRCPLQDSCLEGALERGEEFGVWGGTDERDRRAMRRLVARTAA